MGGVLLTHSLHPPSVRPSDTPSIHLLYLPTYLAYYLCLPACLSVYLSVYLLNYLISSRPSCLVCVPNPNLFLLPPLLLPLLLLLVVIC